MQLTTNIAKHASTCSYAGAMSGVHQLEVQVQSCGNDLREYIVCNFVTFLFLLLLPLQYLCRTLHHKAIARLAVSHLAMMWLYAMQYSPDLRSAACLL